LTGCNRLGLTMTSETAADEREFYSMGEAVKLIGVSRYTLMKWFAEGKVAEVPRNKRNNYRLFRRSDIERIRAYAHQLVLPEQDQQGQGKLFKG
jgi:DNA-binding transcriptional MerR regulator